MPRSRIKSPEIKNVVLYGRVSTTEQAEKELSIPSQFDELRRYCSTHGYSIVNEYIEPGFTAYEDDDRRPVFRRMIGDVTAAEGNVQAILVVYMSRFYRNRTNAGAMKAGCFESEASASSRSNRRRPTTRWGCSSRASSNSSTSTSPDVNGMRTSAAMRKNAELGFHNGSKAPYGFNCGGGGGPTGPDQAEACPEP